MPPRLALAFSLTFAVACGPEPTATPDPSVLRTSSSARALRRAYDGAPPVIPHPAIGASCLSCHAEGRLAVSGLGVAPASPHNETVGMASARCEQCHVYQSVPSLWVASSFEGLSQDLRAGDRLYAGAPPVLPHPVFMREDCLSCHDGDGAREEIRTTHPERTRCLQCHAEQATASTFPQGP